MKSQKFNFVSVMQKTVNNPTNETTHKELKHFIKDSLGTKIELLEGLQKRTNYEKPSFSSFQEWLCFAKNIKDVQQARHALYYGFQPLYDSLIDNSIKDPELRAKAIEALNLITSEGREFITQYYFGQAEHKKIVELANSVGKTLTQINKYFYKNRNIDYNYIYPYTIGTFIKKFLYWIVESDIPMPDTIICCACGPSEITMALSGILKCDTQ